MAHPDETCPGTWFEVSADFGYCDLGDECRNPTPEAHERHVVDLHDHGDDETTI
jgi:hypothetical protein